MTSARKITASRINGAKSRGPRSAAGKAVASRNALRHGLAARPFRRRVPAKDIEQFARALCNGDTDRELYELALKIAENALALQAIDAQQVALVERLREKGTTPLAAGDNSLKRAKARGQAGRSAHEALAALRDRLLVRHRSKLPPSVFAAFGEPAYSAEDDQMVPLSLAALLEEKDARSPTPKRDDPWMDVCWFDPDTVLRSENVVVELATRDLIRLERFVRRIWARQQRAINAFITRELMRHIERGD